MLKNVISIETNKHLGIEIARIPAKSAFLSIFMPYTNGI